MGWCPPTVLAGGKRKNIITVAPELPVPDKRKTILDPSSKKIRIPCNQEQISVIMKLIHTADKNIKA
jgi:hypothetical protein